MCTKLKLTLFFLILKLALLGSNGPLNQVLIMKAAILSLTRTQFALSSKLSVSDFNEVWIHKKDPE